MAGTAPAAVLEMGSVPRPAAAGLDDTGRGAGGGLNPGAPSVPAERGSKEPRSVGMSRTSNVSWSNGGVARLLTEACASASAVTWFSARKRTGLGMGPRFGLSSSGMALMRSTSASCSLPL